MGSEFAGMGHNFPTHDLFVTESQGEILDRTKENLVTSDIAIAHARRQLLAAIKDVQEGRDPVGIFRQGDTNDCRDLLVLTETLNDEIRTDDFCANLEQQDIYELDGAIDQTAAAE
jgi:hypothetical protein